MTQPPPAMRQPCSALPDQAQHSGSPPSFSLSPLASQLKHARQPVSVVLITLNAASALGACLDSVRFADEILVVDSGSQDDSIALAERYGARVIHQDWLGFGRQKQYAVTQAKHDWVLCLDADERLSPELRTSIEAALSQPAAQVYRLARCNYFLGRYLRHGEGYPDWNIRLFNRRYARWSDDSVHEHVLSEVAPASLHGDLLHESAESLSRYLEKQNRYTSLAANAAFASGKTHSSRRLRVRLLLSPSLRFIRLYFFRLGFLDGIPGLIHCVIACFNSFSKYAKLIELAHDAEQNTQKTSKEKT
ncbi:MAG: glycosyltransferase family 2 protein [Pseudomonadota bacterium]